MRAKVSDRFGFAIMTVFFSFHRLCSLAGSEEICTSQWNILFFAFAVFTIFKFGHQEYLKFQVGELERAAYCESQAKATPEASGSC